MPTMNLADPELELIDPTPDVHSLFVHFDRLFFTTKLIDKCIVRWSKRMYSCAGVTSYRRGTMCDIALSEPLLKLRPRKDLVETLLHEMIHAFLFVADRNIEREAHGPKFKAHMQRINQAAGLNITIYHDFHDEVNLYRIHCWRCNGRCQKTPPYFGLVRKAANRAPGPSDFWWATHKRLCGGTFVKIIDSKTNENIPKNNNNTKSVNKNNKVNKDNIATIDKFVVTKPVVSKSPVVDKPVNFGRPRTNSASVIETVRNVWATKQLPTLPGANTDKSNWKKHKNESVVATEPPKKIKKIDDYFKTTATSILKDVYGEEFMISQSNNSQKLKAVIVSDSAKVPPVNIFVNCPTCNERVYSNDINKHLDECLNRDIISELSQNTKPVKSEIILGKGISQDYEDIKYIPDRKPKSEIKIENDSKTHLKSIMGNIQSIPPYRFNTDNHSEIANTIKLESDTKDNKNKVTKSSPIITLDKPSTSKTNPDQTCPSCGFKVDTPMDLHLNKCLGFFDNNTTIPEEGTSDLETIAIEDFNIKSEPGTSKIRNIDQKCPCCDNMIDKPMAEHLEECLGFFSNNTTVPVEGSSVIETIILDDDENDVFDDSQTFNATGTKSPCPCCLKMIEIVDMNDHLDICLSS